MIQIDLPALIGKALRPHVVGLEDFNSLGRKRKSLIVANHTLFGVFDFLVLQAILPPETVLLFDEEKYGFSMAELVQKYGVVNVQPMAWLDTFLEDFRKAPHVVVFYGNGFNLAPEPIIRFSTEGEFIATDRTVIHALSFLNRTHDVTIATLLGLDACMSVLLEAKDYSKTNVGVFLKGLGIPEALWMPLCLPSSPDRFYVQLETPGGTTAELFKSNRFDTCCSAIDDIHLQATDSLSVFRESDPERKTLPIFMREVVLSDESKKLMTAAGKVMGTVLRSFFKS